VAEFDAALGRIAKEGVSGLLIDLRGNTGGMVSSAISLADRLLDAGTIVTIRGRGGAVVRKAEPGVETILPIALLISPETISAAEIFSAALQDHGRAVVVGARSFGKGAVQDIFRLAGGGAVRLTIATCERPSGLPIERHAQGGDPEQGGVWPDPGLEVLLTDDEWATWNAAQLARDFAAPIDFGETTEILGPDDRVLAKAIETLTVRAAQTGSASK
jgi:carboxyl-terminal processing protease